MARALQRCFFCEATEDWFVINDKFKLVDASLGCLGVIPEPKGAYGLRLIKEDGNKIGFTLVAIL